MNRRARAILCVDSGGAVVAGAVMLALHERLAQVHALPSSLVLFIGVVNLVYGTYSGTLVALHKRVPRVAVDVLIAGNLAWSLVCAGVVVVHRDSASAYGLLHVGLEGVYVAALALIEWRYVRALGWAAS